MKLVSGRLGCWDLVKREVGPGDRGVWSGCPGTRRRSVVDCVLGGQEV